MRMKGLPATVFSIVFSYLAVATATESRSWTYKHEAGRCAIRGQCGKEGFFGDELPCPDNGLAQTPAPETRQKLVELCGAKWSESDVCCDDGQVRVDSWHRRKYHRLDD